MKYVKGDSINSNNFSWNPMSSSEKKIAKTSKNYQFLTELVQKCGPYGPNPKKKTFFFFFSEITKPYHVLAELKVMNIFLFSAILFC